jgi:hypothetical protein
MKTQYDYWKEAHDQVMAEMAAIMNFTITKLDRRHAWHDQFPYMVEFHRRKSWDNKTAGGVLEFDQARRWFNETYGWSQDVETREEIIKSMTQTADWKEDQINKHWAYSIRYQEYRVYLNDSALTMFKLKWSNDNLK